LPSFPAFFNVSDLKNPPDGLLVLPGGEPATAVDALCVEAAGRDACEPDPSYVVVEAYVET